jgi:hypothetical protein
VDGTQALWEAYDEATSRIADLLSEATSVASFVTWHVWAVSGGDTEKRSLDEVRQWLASNDYEPNWVQVEVMADDPANLYKYLSLSPLGVTVGATFYDAATNLKAEVRGNNRASVDALTARLEVYFQKFGLTEQPTPEGEEELEIPAEVTTAGRSLEPAQSKPNVVSRFFAHPFMLAGAKVIWATVAGSIGLLVGYLIPR